MQVFIISCYCSRVKVIQHYNTTAVKYRTAYTSANEGEWSGSGVHIRIQTPDSDYFQNLMGTSLSNSTSVIKFS